MIASAWAIHALASGAQTDTGDSRRQASRAGDPLADPGRRCGALRGGRCLGVARPEPQKSAQPFGVCCRGQGYMGGVNAWKWSS